MAKAKKKIAKTKKPANPASQKLRRAEKAAAKHKVKKAAVKKTAPKKIAAKKVPVKKVAKPVKVSGPYGLPEQLRDAALQVLDARQAEDIVTVPLFGRSSVADYLIIASGRAARQVAAIAGYLREAFFKLGVKNIRVEGVSEGNWVLVDAGDVVIHLFRPEVRKYYDLDAIWAGARPPRS